MAERKPHGLGVPLDNLLGITGGRFTDGGTVADVPWNRPEPVSRDFLVSAIREALEPPPAAPAERGKPRTGRPSDAFPWATFELLDELLADRKAALDAGESITDLGLSQQTIADRLNRELAENGLRIEHTRVQRVEKVRDMVLEARGWDLRTLLRSHPDFCAGKGLWCLPTPKKVQQMLGL